MNCGLVTSNGTKVLTVAEYDRSVNFIPMKSAAASSKYRKFNYSE